MLDQAAAAVRDARRITLTTHLHPDGDGIGAALALQHALVAAGKEVAFWCPSPVASLYRFLPGFDAIEVVEAAGERDAGDLLISCDCGDLARLGAVGEVRRRALLNLDHHASNDRFGDLNVVDTQAESTGVVVAALLDALGLAIDATIATCLYTTIVFDTGRFMHGNTTAHTFRFAARLLDCGIDAGAINRALTYCKTPHDLAILRLGLDQLSVDEAEPRLAGIAIDAAAIAAVGEPEDWGELVDVPRSLIGNQIAYLLREAPDRQTVRVSLRANPPFEVQPVAQAFGGGGHKQAAGCTFQGDLAAARVALLPLLRRQLAR